MDSNTDCRKTVGKLFTTVYGRLALSRTRPGSCRNQRGMMEVGTPVLQTRAIHHQQTVSG